MQRDTGAILGNRLTVLCTTRWRNSPATNEYTVLGQRDKIRRRTWITFLLGKRYSLHVKDLAQEQRRLGGKIMHLAVAPKRALTKYYDISNKGDGHKTQSCSKTYLKATAYRTFSLPDAMAPAKLDWSMIIRQRIVKIVRLWGGYQDRHAIEILRTWNMGISRITSEDISSCQLHWVSQQLFT